MSGRIRFGVYELDADAMELRKHGMVIRLQEQPLRVLAALVARPGEVVTREQLQLRIWGKDTFVDFDQSLNKAVNRLRETLNDDASQPRYVETVPRRGYRFVAPVTPARNGVSGPGVATEGSAPASSDKTTPAAREKRSGIIFWRGIGLLACVLLIVGFAVAYAWRRRAADPPDPITLVPFTSYPGAELNPSFSPDGNQIAFAWNGGNTAFAGGFDLYVKQVGVENPLRLTSRPADGIVPAWSPDGRSIAFLRLTYDSDAIYMIPAIGGPERKLADVSACGCGSELSWSPDGKWLALTDWRGSKIGDMYGAHVYLLNPETLEKRSIPDPSSQCVSTYQPAFSPDGKTLAVACMLSIGSNLIYLEPLRGGPAQQVASTSGKFEGLSWTADGKSLIYDTDARLWRIPAQGGRAEQLLYAQDAWLPAIAHSGKRLAFTRSRYVEEVWRIDLATSAKPKAAAQELVASTYGQWGAHISPDGKRVAFNSDRSGTNQVWVSNVDGSRPVQLTSFTRGALGVPQWAPDSQRIAFDTDADSPNVQTYTMRIDDGLPRRLATKTDTASHPSWSGDGHWIYFDEEKHGGGVWKVPATGGQAIRLSNDTGLFPQEAEDGARVFYIRRWREAALWSAAVMGGDERQVTAAPTIDIGWHWAPARNGIYFIDGETNPASLNLFDFADHRVHRISNLRNGGDSDVWGAQVSVSRDGRTVVYSDAARKESDIVLVEGFH